MVVVVGGEIAAREGLQPVGESERELAVDDVEDRLRSKPMVSIGLEEVLRDWIFLSAVEL